MVRANALFAFDLHLERLAAEFVQRASSLPAPLIEASVHGGRELLAVACQHRGRRRPRKVGKLVHRLPRSAMAARRPLPQRPVDVIGFLGRRGPTAG